MRNLAIAFPERSVRERRQILRRVYAGLGRQLAEFCRFPSYTKENVSRIAIYDGFENYDAARRPGKGVLLLTGHFGGWEVGSYAHSVYGNPIKIIVRDLDNPYVNNLVRRYRTRYGNETYDKQEFARSLLGAMREGETVGMHLVVFDSPHDTLLFTHDAKSRLGFAEGAVRAAEWIKGRTGFYEFPDVVDQV